MNSFNLIFRSLFKQRLNSAIIVVSLAIGMACISIISLFITHEQTVDQFHQHYKQIYALKCDDPFADNAYIYHCRAGSAEYMKANFSQVEDFCRLNNANPQVIKVNNQSFFNDAKVVSASDNFFGFFTYDLYSGFSKVLEAKTDLVISENLALKYYGTTDVVGQPITLNEDQMTITGVFRHPVGRTQIKFDMVRLMEDDKDSRCYVRLAAATYPDKLEKQFEAAKETIPIIHGGTPGAYSLVSMKEAYFDQTRRSSVEASRDKTDLWIALCIGLLIIGIASSNYLRLVSNKLLQKNKEFAIRKINGSSRLTIIYRFMTEILIIMLISFAISLILVLLILPSFNLLTGALITPSYIFQVKQLILLGAIVLFLLIITLVFVYSRITSKSIAHSLKSKVFLSSGSSHFPFSYVFQITGSIILIICSIAIIRQMNFITEKPIGLDKEVFEVKIPGLYRNKVAAFKDELLKSTSVSSISIAGASPVLEHFLVLLEYERDGVKKEYSPAGFSGDENYISTLGIELIEGDDFSTNTSTNKNKCLINESLAMLFKGENLIGKSLPGNESIIVTGIVRDFHYSDLKKIVEPCFIGYKENGNHLLVKAAENQQQQARNAITQAWEKLVPDYPVNIETIGDRFEWMHRENKNYIQLMGTFCIISIFLSMIGLFAISFQSSQLRTKEIGIRKVNGAKIWEVMAMLNQDFVKWVAIAFLIATPIAYYAMHKWLQNFAYKTGLHWWIFALAGLIALVIALLTVSWQSWKAARRNPVEALRYE